MRYGNTEHVKRSGRVKNPARASTHASASTTLVKNIVSMYGVRATGYVVPLITLPYLARVLDVDGFGALAVGQSVLSWLALFMEFGFSLAAAREVARSTDNPDVVASTAAAVAGAKIILAIPALFFALLLAYVLGAFPLAYRAMVWWAWIGAFTQAFTPTWYFLGKEQVSRLAVIDVTARMLAAFAVIRVVNEPHEAITALSLQVIGSSVVCAFGVALMYREIPIRLPRRTEVLRVLRAGASMSLFQGAVSLYTVANGFILGLFAPSREVAYFTGADKILQAMLALRDPVAQSIYPRMSYLLGRGDSKSASQLAGRSLQFLLALAVVLGAVVSLMADVIIRLVLGVGYEPATSVLRIIVLRLAPASVNSVLAIQYMLPLGLEREVNVVVVAGAMVNLGLASCLAPRLGAIGMAWTVVSTEALVAIMLSVVSRKHRIALAVK